MRRFLRNYYSKLILFSLAILFVLIFLVIGVIFYYLYSSQKAVEYREYDTCMQEIMQEYESIHRNLYKVYSPLLMKENHTKWGAFIEGESAGAEHLGLNDFINGMIKSAVTEDERIEGLYIHSLATGNRYLYDKDANMGLVKVNYDLEGCKIPKETIQKTISGIRTMKSIDGKVITVFPVQSGVMEVGGAGGQKSNYWVAVLYSVDCFDEIVAGYGLEDSARFILTTATGELIYDSHGEYKRNEVLFYEYNQMVDKESNLYFMQDDYKGSTYLAFYTIPEEGIAFRFDETVWLVLMLAIVVCVIVVLIMLMIRRLLQKKFGEIETGMQQIGENKLDYRLPVTGTEDEFSRIAIGFNQMCANLEEAIRRNYIYELLQQKAEYMMLQTTVNPHFLYNSLESIREKLIEEGQEDSSEMVLLLSRIFEYQIRGDSIVTIRRELGLLQTYLEFASIRYEYAFSYEIDFDEEILDYKIPKLIFQPVVENYIVHGFKRDGNDKIHIRGFRSQLNGKIYISFYDNGRGITKEQEIQLRMSLQEGAEGSMRIGLRNVHNRLQIIFGKDSYVDIQSNEPDPGVCISLIFDGKKDISLEVGE